MDYFNYQHGELYAEDVPISVIVKEVGSPCYIYSRTTLERHWHAFDSALGHHPHGIYYAVKANSNVALLNVLARLGSGFDIVSGGELARVIAAGGDPKKTIFSGVGKLPQEIIQALDANIECFNVESTAELFLINEIASQQHKVAPIALRINPNVDAKTHPYIATGLKENKFGIAMDKVMGLYLEAKEMPHIQIQGVACHIGSQLTSIDPFLQALSELIKLHDELAEVGIPLQHIDMGGGLGAPYHDETPPIPAEYASALVNHLKPRDIKLLIAPGRAICANAGILVTQVILLKHNKDKNFAVVDAGMNDFMRPALYDAWQEIIPVAPAWQQKNRVYDVVGPICETADCFATDRSLAINPQDLLAIRSAGAYGFTMSSNYNSRPKPAEVMVDRNGFHIIRPRETLEQLYQSEVLMP